MAPNFTLKPPSIPLVGSSSKRISGFVRRTFPSASRCCCPPLRSSGFCSLNSVSSIFSSISSTALGSLPQQTASSSSAVISVKCSADSVPDTALCHLFLFFLSVASKSHRSVSSALSFQRRFHLTIHKYCLSSPASPSVPALSFLSHRKNPLPVRLLQSLSLHKFPCAPMSQLFSQTATDAPCPTDTGTVSSSFSRLFI